MNSCQQFSQRYRLLCTASLAATLSLAAMSAQAQSASSPSMGGAMRPMNPGATMPGHGSDAMHKSMMGGMEKMQQMRPTGDIDKDFAVMMKMHHQQAIEMAKPQIEHGKSAEMKALAGKIVKDQTKEIAQLDAWIRKHP